ncbi:MAG: hypothetical protein O3B67_01555 [archaeon]|nr:hypothetical protein [archaeon]
MIASGSHDKIVKNWLSDVLPGTDKTIIDAALELMNEAEFKISKDVISITISR